MCVCVCVCARACVYIYIYIYTYAIVINYARGLDYFFQNFSHECKLCIVWDCFLAKYYFNQTKIFFAIENGGKSNRVLSS